LNVICLTPTETCRRIGIGRTKMYELLKAGKIPHLRVGRRILIPVRELEEWVHENALNSVQCALSGNSEGGNPLKGGE